MRSSESSRYQPSQMHIDKQTGAVESIETKGRSRRSAYRHEQLAYRLHRVPSEYKRLTH